MRKIILVDFVGKKVEEMQKPDLVHDLQVLRKTYYEQGYNLCITTDLESFGDNVYIIYDIDNNSISKFLVEMILDNYNNNELDKVSKLFQLGNKQERDLVE